MAGTTDEGAKHTHPADDNNAATRVDADRAPDTAEALPAGWVPRRQVTAGGSLNGIAQRATRALRLAISGSHPAETDEFSSAVDTVAVARSRASPPQGEAGSDTHS